MSSSILNSVIQQFDSAPYGASARLFISGSAPIPYHFPYEPVLSSNGDLVFATIESLCTIPARFRCPREEAVLYEAVVGVNQMEPSSAFDFDQAPSPRHWVNALRGTSGSLQWQPNSLDRVASKSRELLVKKCRHSVMLWNWDNRTVRFTTSELELKGCIPASSLTATESESQIFLHARHRSLLEWKLLTALEDAKAAIRNSDRLYCALP